MNSTNMMHLAGNAFNGFMFCALLGAAIGAIPIRHVVNLGTAAAEELAPDSEKISEVRGSGADELLMVSSGSDLGSNDGGDCSSLSDIEASD